MVRATSHARVGGRAEVSVRSRVQGVVNIAPLQLGLYTILPSATLYGVWHKKEGSVGGGRILRNDRAIVLQ